MSRHSQIMQQLRVARQERGLSYAELGRRCNMGASTLHAWEHGHRSPVLENLIIVARVLGFNLKLEEK